MYDRALVEVDRRLDLEAHAECLEEPFDLRSWPLHKKVITVGQQPQATHLACKKNADFSFLP